MRIQKKTNTRKERTLNEYPTDVLLPINDFLKRYEITKKDFDKTGFKWSSLNDIFRHYLWLKSRLEHPAAAIVSILLSKEAKDQGVHSVRYRIKDPNSLIEKIIRKKMEDKRLKISVQNYQEKITDLIGIRILHTFKYDWYRIHNYLSKTFAFKPGEPPLLYYKEGDENKFIKLCRSMGCKHKMHPIGYRSVHYIVTTQLTQSIYCAEIQVRTIFEEGWSEIDHKIRYAYKGHISSSFNDHLSALNTACGNADQLGNIIRNLERTAQEEIFKSKSSRGKK